MKKPAMKKAPAKKAAAKRGPARKSVAKKTPAKKGPEGYTVGAYLFCASHQMHYPRGESCPLCT
ncbi:MAG: hypothetical protein JWQ50_5364 [Caballeronia mineralivorans]|jgi:hypothetical protein|nr:hypothetical protein [Caballeronia mineralivorans]MEA3101923.1 hypothetical protein [Caballeronia mineralivorans]